MLAAHYARIRQGQPIRYALGQMDPAHLQAIQNYLRINNRAAGLPQLHQQAQGVLGPIYQHTGGELGLRTEEEHPLLPHLFQQIMGGHHDALAMYLDLLGEHSALNGSRGLAGVMHPNTGPIGAHHDLVDWLTQIHMGAIHNQDAVHRIGL